MESDVGRLASQVVIELEPLNPCIVASFASRYSQKGLVETDAAEETEGLFSDDTGFYSAVDDFTSQDEGEAEDEEERLEREVERNYPVLLEKYCGLNHKAAGMKDPFNEVDFTELCTVLKMSAEKSGLMKSAELLDVALQIFFRQVSVCHRSVVRLAEVLQTRGRRLGQLEQNELGQGEYTGGNQQEARQGRAPMIRLGEKRGRWVDGENAEYSFVKELSEQFVIRRVRINESMECIVQNPYLDFEVDLGEFYNGGMEIEELEGSQNQSVVKLIRAMGIFADARTMGNIFLPGGALFCGNADVDVNREEGVDLDLMGMEVDAENMEPDTLPLSLQSEVEDVLGLSAGDNLAIMVMEGGENVPPKERGKKGSKKSRKRRVPFGEHQNITEEEGQMGMKRTRLEGQGDSVATVGEGEESSDNLGENGNAAHEQSTLLILGEDIDSWASELDLTIGVDGHDDGIFRPASPLSGQDWSLLNFTAKNHQYDMQAIKTKFKEIVNSSPPEKGDITFVDILKQCEMNILARTDHCIFRSYHKDDMVPPAFPTATKEISVGVAFLAMLHNAASEGFYLVEDPEGAFKVSREEPVEGEVD